jgi:diaminopimelate epimerase
LPFVKMHGLGNDYVYIDMFGVGQLPGEPADLARKLADRHFGVGGDGMILVEPSKLADVRMRMFNADGSEGAMCGNGIRCVAKLAFEAGHVRGRRITVETRAGLKTLELITAGETVEAVRVNMGPPRLNPADIPVKLPGERAINVPIILNGRRFDMTCVSMGNPHAVIYVDDVSAVPLEQVGPELETHPLFPRKINVHFVQVVSPREVVMRTWERGSGVTLACGTGASAVCVAGVLTVKTGRSILAHLPGGDLKLEWRASDNHVYMTGPAVEVFSGDWPA